MLYDSTHTGARRGKFAETGGRMPGAGAWGSGELGLTGAEFLSGMSKKFWRWME